MTHPPQSPTQEPWAVLAGELRARLLAQHMRSGMSASGRPDYYNELHAALSDWRQTKHRREMLRESASPALRRLFDEASHKSEWVDAMAHAFYDGVVKAGMNLGMAQQLEMPDIAANALIEMTRVMGDVAHNYRSIIPPGRAPAIESVLRAYEVELIPLARRTLTTLARQEGWDDDRIAGITRDIAARNYTGLDHLARLKL